MERINLRNYSEANIRSSPSLQVRRVWQSLIKPVVGGVYYYSLTRFLPRVGIKILTYHSLEKEDSENFRKEMLYLKEKGYTCLELDLLPFYLAGVLKMPERVFILTFDDGFRDNYLYAFPIIKEFRLKATFFLTYNYIDTPRRYWWEAKKAILSWREIEEMKRYGLSFGSHTLTHANLLSLTTDRVQKEIRESKLRLEDKLGIPVNFFSYPYGFWNEKIVETVKESGYKGACSIRYGVSFSPEECFKLCRINIEPYENLGNFKKKISGSFDWLKKFGLRNQPSLKFD